MALTITNHLIRSADTPYPAKLCDGRWTLTWLAARVLTEGQAATKTAQADSNIPANDDPEVHDEGSGPARTPGRASSVFADSAAVMQAPEVPAAY
jgi:hypothetical protein